MSVSSTDPTAPIGDLFGPPMATVKKWNAVATWNWAGSSEHTDTCAICRNVLSDHCLECQATNEPGDGKSTVDCFVVWGVCNHKFHHHCMSRWLRQHHVCPIDHREWELQATFSNKA